MKWHCIMTTARLFPRLRHRADLRTLGFVALELALLAATWSGGVRHPLAVAASFFFAFVCCIVAHNHMHVSVFRGRGWNRLFQILLMFGAGQPPTGIVTAHNERHHGQPDSEHDFVRTSLARFRSNALNLLAFPFLSIAAMYREKPDDLARWKASRPHLYRQALLERAVFYPALIVLLAVDWRATLLFLLLPWICAQLALVGVNLLQHQDCDTASEYDHSRNVTGRVVNWFLLNNGFHTAHHLRPATHWSLLPDFHREQVVPRINPALDHRTFCGLLIERLLRPPVNHAR
jgi:beta-carotene hydroxylase